MEEEDEYAHFLDTSDGFTGIHISQNLSECTL